MPIGPRPRVALIFNPVAGGPSSPPLAALTERLEPRCELVVHETSAERDADACAVEALQQGCDLVVAAGGDGTTSLVARELMGRGIPLGVLPCGTSNSIADALGIPGDLDAACDTLFTGAPRAIDMARCGGQGMMLLCSVGYYAETIDGASREQKNRWGLFAYIASGVKRLFDMEPFEVELETEDLRVRCQATAVTVANIAPPKSVLAQGPSYIHPDDGLLDVTVVSASGLADAVAAGLHLFKTAALQTPATRGQIGYLACRRVRVTTDRPMKLVVDGETTGETPVEVECVPRALRLMVPQDTARDRPPPSTPEGDLSRIPDLEVESR